MTQLTVYNREEKEDDTEDKIMATAENLVPVIEMIAAFAPALGPAGIAFAAVV